MLKFKNLFVFVVSTVITLPAFGAPPNLSRLVVVGDSLSAGVENFSLLDTQQTHGYASLIAQQAGVSLTLPLVPDPGAPNVLQLRSLEPVPDVEPAPGTLPSLPRDNPFDVPTNVSVPGVTLNQALTLRPNPANTEGVAGWATIVLGFPNLFYGQTPTEIELAKQLHPTTVIEALGNNDALVPALTGAINMLTPLNSFAQDYKTVLDNLAAPGRTLIVATIPDVTKVPYFISPQAIAEQYHLPLGIVVSMLGIRPNDYVRITAEPDIYKILTGTEPGPLPASCPSPLAALSPNPIPCVLTAADANTIRNTITAYNLVIGVQAALHGALIVDLHGLVDQIYTNGFNADNQHLTANFLGGLFSLDGIHPTNTGYAVIANRFIDTMNAWLGAHIPDVDVNAVAAQDPLVFNK